MKIAGNDLRLGPQTAMDSSNIPLWLLGNSEDFTDVPLACEDSISKLKKQGSPGRLQSLRKSYITEKFHFGTEILSFLHKRMPHWQKIFNVSLTVVKLSLWPRLAEHVLVRPSKRRKTCLPVIAHADLWSF